jgi:hypothetical protein
LAAEITTVVKVPISQIEEWLRSLHALPDKLDSFNLEDNNLVLHFKESPSEGDVNANDPSSFPSSATRRRRTHKKRNRMKTRGWPVIARITNAKGQKCSIYKPFVEALQGKKLSTEEQRKAVETVLRSNRNKPTPDSIQYFLENTLEYLKGA